MKLIYLDLKTFLVRAAAAAVFLLTPYAVFSHGVEVSEVTAEAADAVRTVRFVYSTGESMSYAKIRVYPPSNPEVEILQAITSWNGDFSFIPNEEGDWRVTAEDGMGHKGEVIVSNERGQRALKGGSEQEAPLQAGRLPLPFAALLGLSVLFNIFTVWYFFKNRKKQSGDSYAH